MTRDVTISVFIACALQANKNKSQPKGCNKNIRHPNGYNKNRREHRETSRAKASQQKQREQKTANRNENKDSQPKQGEQKTSTRSNENKRQPTVTKRTKDNQKQIANIVESSIKMNHNHLGDTCVFIAGMSLFEK